MKNRTMLFVILLMAASLAQVVSDIYLPSMPYIATGLHVSLHQVQLSFFSFMSALAFSQLFYGQLSDAFGRRRFLLFGLILCSFGSILCLLAPNIGLFNSGRAIQGLGAGAGLALSRSITRDCFSGVEMAKIGSYLSIANIGIMTAAPFIGSYLQHWFNWRASFLFLSIYAIISLLVVFYGLPETNQHQSRDHLQAKVIKRNLKTLLTSRAYLPYAAIMALAYGGIAAWLTSGPIVLQVEYHLTPTGFGWLCLGIGCIYALGSLSNARLLNYFTPRQMLSYGVITMAIGALLTAALSFVPHPNVWTVYCPILVFLFGTSMIFINAYACALTPFGEIAGIASALSAFLQIFGGAISSGIISLLPNHSALPMGIILSICGLTSLWLVLTKT